MLKYYIDKIKDKYSGVFSICDVEAKDYSCYIDNIIFENKDRNKIKENIVYPIKSYFKTKTLNSLFINYHYFEDLQIGNIKQQSLQKYNQFKLDLVSNKSVLDIGCNTGYNVFKMSSKALSVCGIDINEQAIKTAIELNTIHYNNKNVEFIHDDIFNYDGKYDVILASSIFHYFVGRQQEFINKCYELLNDDGLLVLECGIVISNNKSEIIKRDVGDICEYPTKETLLEYSNRFSLIYEGVSVIQDGDKIERFIYHLKKKL